MALRYATIILTAMVLALAAAVAVSAVEPKKADAASYVKVRGCTGAYIYLTPAEYRSLYLHNQTRAKYKLTRFCVHPALQKAARAHSKEMIDRDYFSHNSYNGESFSKRLTRFGYKWRYAGENIAYGSGSYGTADNRFNAWMKSTGHRANILNKNFREIGIGAVYGNFRGKNVTMWTADFGTR